MSDMADDFRALRDDRKERRARLGVRCPTCTRDRPRSNPTILLPGQRCRVCGFRDVRPDPDLPGALA